MKPPEFEYVRPASLDDAITALRSGEEAKLLAGGQSLVPLLNMRFVHPRVLVDITRIAGLRSIARVNGTLRIGATATQREAEISPAVADACPLLAQALGFVGHPQIRNRGTVGGSLAHADPAAELPAVVLLLDGVVHARGGGGERAIPAVEFFRSHLTTALEPDEVLTAVELPVSAPGAGWDCTEITRRPGDFPLCGAACQVELGRDGAFTDVRLGLYGVADRPIRAVAAEDRLRGEQPEPRLVAEAAKAATGDVSCAGDMHASPAYRRHLAEVIARRTIEAAVQRGNARAEH
ncbi:MAG: FAD binding domain-containing protein [Solirubrobacteraceae bacterium]